MYLIDSPGFSLCALAASPKPSPTSFITPSPTPTSGAVFHLSINEWTALAAAAQALAAFGAIALLIVTLLSQRSAKEANQQATKLAEQTEALVGATRSAQSLAVQPVIEVSVDMSERRVYVTNKGNGPLLTPIVRVNDVDHLLTTRDIATNEFKEVAALASGITGFCRLQDTDKATYEVVIKGWTLTGIRFNGHVAFDSVNRGRVLVASPEEVSA